jgi:hypothetical protein
MNPLHTSSQSSFIIKQKAPLMEMNLFNLKNFSHIFDNKGKILKQILYQAIIFL